MCHFCPSGQSSVQIPPGAEALSYPALAPPSLWTPPITSPLTDGSAAQVIAGYGQIVAQAHAAGLNIFGATLTPFEGAGYYTDAGRRSARR
jgi:hypothetical protein